MFLIILVLLLVLLNVIYLVKGLKSRKKVKLLKDNYKFEIKVIINENPPEEAMDIIQKKFNVSLSTSIDIYDEIKKETTN